MASSTQRSIFWVVLPQVLLPTWEAWAEGSDQKRTAPSWCERFYTCRPHRAVLPYGTWVLARKRCPPSRYVQSCRTAGK